MSGTYARRTTTITASMLSGWITPSRITVFTISIITAILKDRRSPAATSIRSYTAVSSMIRRKKTTPPPKRGGGADGVTGGSFLEREAFLEQPVVSIFGSDVCIRGDVSYR